MWSFPGKLWMLPHKFQSDDTDVFILLIHYYQQCSLTCIVLMEDTSRMRAVIDIGATEKQHADIAAHALTGCDTVAFMCGISS